jgi:hypothetical protein
LISGAAHHHAIDEGELCLRIIERGDTAVEDDGQARMLALQCVHERIIERRDFAVLPGRKPFQPRHARMHDKRVSSGRTHLFRQREQRLTRLLIIDTEPAFDGNRHLNRALHRRDAIGDKIRLAHEAGAERAALHAIGGTADIEVDLAVAEIFRDLCGLCERGGL